MDTDTDTAGTARELFTECVRAEQSARRVASAEDAAAVRAEVRRLARGAGVRIRTDRLADTVVVVRRDAALWTQDTATMRAKLTPPSTTPPTTP